MIKVSIKKFLPFLALVIIYAFTNHNNDNNSSPINESNDMENISDSIISYKNHIQPIWDKYCIRCHDINNDEVATSLVARYSYKDLMNARYIKPSDPEKSYVYKIVKGKIPSMPPQSTVDTFKLNQSEVELLKKWIEQGAVNN